MTQEEKAKRYDEALELARDYHKANIIGKTPQDNMMLEDIFPELVKSEDELTWLKKYIEEEAYSLSTDIRDDEDRIKLKNMQKALAWLEKQKPVEHSSEDENYNGEDYGIDGLWHAQKILEETLGKVDGYQTDDGILEHKCAIAAVNKLYEQKPAWSEEDEEMFELTISLLNCNLGCRKWLKSLKERMGG